MIVVVVCGGGCSGDCWFLGGGFCIWNLLEDLVIVVVVCGGGCSGGC